MDLELSLRLQRQTSQYTQIEQEDQKPLKPIKKLIPANQIITKNYLPDSKTIVKLVSPIIRKSVKIIKDTSKSQIQQLIKKYHFKIAFQQQDSLGYFIINQLKKNSSYNLVYIKFNNIKHIKYHENAQKYLAGCFIPLSQLLKPELKADTNVYSFINPGKKVPFGQYNQNAALSFGSNCFAEQNQLRFSSNYEGSNLFMAIKKGHLQYDLILQNDINSKGTTQWFNFTVFMFQDGCYKFNIINLAKSRSLFEKGMKIPYLSTQNKILNNVTWTKGCHNISYGINQILREGITSNCYSTLHFQYNSTFKQDTVIFSYGYPYGSLEAEKFLNKISQKKISALFSFNRIKICETLSGLPVYIYHIKQRFAFPQKQLNNTGTESAKSFTSTSYNFNSTSQFSKSKQTKGIVFIGRQHPGQSQGSFIIQGIMQFLLENNQYDRSKKNFHYYIFPMVNVDGVYYGNYRTNLSGNDLNRVWKQPRKDFHCEVYHVKKYLHYLNKITPLKIIIDIHGHSSAFNSFFYGNPVKKQNINQINNPKLFPYFCSKNMNEVSFLQSNFKITECKKNSARVVLNQMFPKALVYTFENSFHGYLKGKKIIQYTPEKYRKLGRNLMISYLQFSKISQRNQQFKDKLLKQIEQLAPLKNNTSASNESESDSEAEQDLIEFQEEFKKIDEVAVDSQYFYQQKTLKEKPSSLKNLRIYSTKNRLQSKTQQRNKYSSSPQESEFLGSKNQNSTKLNLNVMNSNGFLSIVKIDTNKNLNQNKQKIKFQKIEQKFQKIEQKQNKEQFAHFQPVKINQIMQNQVKNISIYDYKCFNEKEYYLKMRKAHNPLLDELDSKKYLKTLGIKKQIKHKINEQ